jgi:RecA/RadA recombinase
LEEAWTGIDSVLKQAQELRDEGVVAPLMICWDSIAASVPERILTGESGDAHMSIEAKLNNQNVRRLRQAIKKTDVAVVGINHFYMSVPKNPYEIARIIIKGGEELSFFSTLIIKTDQGAKIERTVKGEKQQIGRTTRFTVHKGHIHGRTTVKNVYVVDKGILESDQELEEYKKTLRGEV